MKKVPTVSLQFRTPVVDWCIVDCRRWFFRRIQEILPGRVKEWNETTCVANTKAEEKLKRLKKIQEVCDSDSLVEYV